jgi:hypothetical protein
VGSYWQRLRKAVSDAYGSEWGTMGVSAVPVLRISDGTWDAAPVVLSCTILENKGQSASTRFFERDGTYRFRRESDIVLRITTWVVA